MLLALGWWQAQPPLDIAPTGGIEGLALQLVKEGGAWAMLALTLWFYRRDWVRLADQTKPLMDLAASSAASNREVVAALNANTDISRQILSHLDTLTVKMIADAQLPTPVLPPPGSRRRSGG